MQHPITVSPGYSITNCSMRSDAQAQKSTRPNADKHYRPFPESDRGFFGRGVLSVEMGPDVVDNCGTFFGQDNISKGCDDRLETRLPVGPELTTNSLTALLKANRRSSKLIISST